MTQGEFAALCGNFWAQAVWAAKKAQRGEFRACQRGIHEHLVEGCLRAFQEEAILAGRQSYPLGRRAESWLTQEQAAATSAGTRPEKGPLLDAVSRLSAEFARSAAAIAAARGWPAPNPSELRSWLSSQVPPAS